MKALECAQGCSDRTAEMKVYGEWCSTLSFLGKHEQIKNVEAKMKHIAEVCLIYIYFVLIYPKLPKE